MRLPRPTHAISLAAILTAIGLGLAGCSAPVATDPTAGTDSPSDAATDGSSTGPWDACPAIVDSLNGNTDDPFDYEQLDAASFNVQEVGSDVLERACVIGVTSPSTTAIMWAILPGEAALVESIAADLLDAGFEESGELSGLLGNTTTGLGALIAVFDSGAALDDYLVYPTAFAPYDESLVYVGTFALG